MIGAFLAAICCLPIAQKSAMMLGMSKDLDAEVRDLLVARRGSWRQICVESGVSHSWISQFVRGKIPNPGYATLRDLHRSLGGNKSNRKAA